MSILIHKLWTLFYFVLLNFQNVYFDIYFDLKTKQNKSVTKTYPF